MEETGNMLMLNLDLDDNGCLYISQGKDARPVGRIRIVDIHRRRVVVAIDGDENQFGVYREKMLRKKLGADAVERLNQRFRKRVARPAVARS
jgi:hypothetical protein